MEKGMKKIRDVVVILTVLVLLISCMQPFSQRDGKGNILISFRSSKGATIQPSNIQIASYVLSGDGPGTASLTDETFTTSPHTVNDLDEGTWTFTVNGKNSSGDIVASGTVTATVVKDDTVTVAIELRPLNEGTGTGTFVITGTIPSGITITSFTGVISPEGGSDIDFDVTVNGTSLSYSNDTLIASSNYEVTLHAETSDGKQWSDIYALRIYDGLDSPLTINLLDEDFRTMPVSPSLTLDPASITSGTTNTAYSFTLTAEHIPTGVSQVTFDYNFGDGSSTATGSQSATVSNNTASITLTHTYTTSSAYGIVATVSDGSTPLATGYASVIIGTVTTGEDYDLTVLDSWIAANSGGYGYTKDTWDISTLPTGCVFDLKFDTVGMPDRYIIQYPDGVTVLDTGWRGDSYYDGNPNYPGGVVGGPTGEEDAIFAKGAQQYFTIVIMGGEPGTVWYYSMKARMP